MNEELKKALETLIEETMGEIEDLRKSRFAASEVKVEGPGTGIDGKPSDGSLGKDEDGDDEDDDKDDKKAEKAEDAMKADHDKDDDKDEDDDKAEKSEGVNRQADPDGGHHKMDKGEGVNRQADPDGGHHKMDKAEDKKEDKDDKKSDKHEKKEKKLIDKLDSMHKDDSGMPKGTMAKSEAERDDLMKSFMDAKVAPLEKKLADILALVNKIADQPVAAKGTSYKAVPFAKSDVEFGGEPLTKNQIGNKLFDLKKSGTKIDSVDITKAELGQDLQAIVKKYNLA
jgi:hypothetical protein